MTVSELPANVTIAISALNQGSGSWGYGGGINKLYGPVAADLRRQVASKLHRLPLTKSDKRCQFGNLRAALMLAVEIPKDCIAVMDDNFNALAATIR